MDQQSVYKKNFRLHLIEGVLYIGSGGLISSQTFFPALITRLGGSNVAIGALPVVVYLTFFLPQIIAANYVPKDAFRKPWVLRGGIIQRLQVLSLALAVGLFGLSRPKLTLVAVFVILTANQVIAGFTSPAWFDLVAKTTRLLDRGKLMGLRSSIGAAVGFLNGFLLMFLLTYLEYPYNYASSLALAFLYQFGSWLVQRNLIEEHPSSIKEPQRLANFAADIKSVLRQDTVFFRFLIASTFLTIGLTPVGFFTVAAIRKFHLDETYVGIFTVLAIGAQIVSGAFLGWIADWKGNKISLILSGTSLGIATTAAIMSQSAVFYYVVFVFVGINVGAEMMIRYNFAVECSSEHDRPLYIGLMNAWFAPFYLFSLLAGWVSERYGYDSVFGAALLCTIIGIVLLARVPDPRRVKLALSSK